ncbi:MAG: ABC transporter substrate-binding protein [Caldilineaceae bacterium]|nr:ABC transporter substrate-binding protein [Caldilineaceae bacterium]
MPSNRTLRSTVMGLALVFVLLLAGCTSVQSPAAPAAVEAGGEQPFAGQTLIVTSYGGTWEEFMRENILPDFEAETGATVELAVGLSKDWMAKLRAAGVDNPPYDVVIANETWISTGRLEGFFDQLSTDAIPNIEDIHPALRMQDDIGVLGLLNPLGIAYRTDLVETPPTSWLDLWNEEFKGKVGIYNIANSAAPQFLMMLAKIETGDPKNWEVGLEKIKELAPFKQTDFSGDMENLLIQGEVVVGILDAPAAARLKQQGVPIEFVLPEEGLFMFEQNMNITKGSQVKDLAAAFLDYMLSEPVQTKWAAAYYVTPGNTNVTIEGELAQLIPVTAEKIGMIEKWDWIWLNTGPREEMVNRWNREISGQ